MNHNFFI